MSPRAWFYGLLLGIATWVVIILLYLLVKEVSAL